MPSNKQGTNQQDQREEKLDLTVWTLGTVHWCPSVLHCSNQKRKRFCKKDQQDHESPINTAQRGNCVAIKQREPRYNERSTHQIDNIALEIKMVPESSTHSRTSYISALSNHRRTMSSSHHRRTGVSSSHHRRTTIPWEVQVAEDLHQSQQYRDFSDHDCKEARPQSAHSKEAQNEAEAIMLDCLTSIVTVYMKAEEYHKAKQAMAQVLARDPHNFAALLQMGKVCMLDGFGSFEEAESALNGAVRNCETRMERQEAEELLTELARRKQLYKKKAKAMFRKMRKSARSS